jgi:hypothetical protein
MRYRGGRCRSPLYRRCPRHTRAVTPLRPWRRRDYLKRSYRPSRLSIVGLLHLLEDRTGPALLPIHSGPGRRRVPRRLLRRRRATGGSQPHVRRPPHRAIAWPLLLVRTGSGLMHGRSRLGVLRRRGRHRVGMFQNAVQLPNTRKSCTEKENPIEFSETEAEARSSSARSSPSGVVSSRRGCLLRAGRLVGYLAALLPRHGRS